MTDLMASFLLMSGGTMALLGPSRQQPAMLLGSAGAVATAWILPAIGLLALAFGQDSEATWAAWSSHLKGVIPFTVAILALALFGVMAHEQASQPSEAPP